MLVHDLFHNDTAGFYVCYAEVTTMGFVKVML